MRTMFRGLQGRSARVQKEILSDHERKFKAGSTLAINARHRDCLRRAVVIMRSGATYQPKDCAGYTAIHLNEALRAVGEVNWLVVWNRFSTLFSASLHGKMRGDSVPRLSWQQPLVCLQNRRPTL